MDLLEFFRSIYVVIGSQIFAQRVAIKRLKINGFYVKIAVKLFGSLTVFSYLCIVKEKEITGPM